MCNCCVRSTGNRAENKRELRAVVDGWFAQPAQEAPVQSPIAVSLKAISLLLTSSARFDTRF